MNQYNNINPVMGVTQRPADAVTDEAGLRNAITEAPYEGPTEIVLANNITLTASTLSIPANKKIILAGTYTLSQSANTVPTITVNGELTVDGITVTHGTGITGRGIQINNGGKLTMESGKVSGNSTSGVYEGSGVHMVNSSTFIMNGGEITGNTHTTNYYGGGGVFVADGTFTMNGGEIYSNTAALGAGGVQLWGGSMTMNNNAKIHTNTGSNGGGIATGGTVTINGGEIYGNTATGTGGGVYVDQYGSAPAIIITDGEIYDNKAVSGGGVYSSAPITLSGATKIYKNTASFDGGGIGVAYANLPNLTVGADVIFAENKAATAYNRNPVDDALYYSRIFGTHWTTPFIQGYNNYDISYTNGTPFVSPAEVTLSATKLTVGATLEAERFTFTVFNQEGNPVATATNNANGNIIFPGITLTMEGTFTYTMRETGVPTGWTPDATIFRAVVSVTNNGTGQLMASVSYPDGVPVFTNIFGQPLLPTTATIRACKRVCGACLCGNDFLFAVFDQNGNEVARAANDACGNIVFPALTFAQTGVFSYTIRELNISNFGWITDTSIFSVTVDVTDNGAGQLVARVDYTNGKPVFINHFCPPCTPRNCRRC